MELVVTLAVLGIIAAIGTPVLLNNISTARNIDAQNTLKSIFLMEKNYFAENNCYYVPTGSTARTDINQKLFGSTPANKEAPISAPSSNDFAFSIEDTSNSASCPQSYKASATLNNDVYTINEQNLKTGIGFR